MGGLASGPTVVRVTLFPVQLTFVDTVDGGHGVGRVDPGPAGLGLTVTPNRLVNYRFP